MVVGTTPLFRRILVCFVFSKTRVEEGVEQKKDNKTLNCSKRIQIVVRKRKDNVFF